MTELSVLSVGGYLACTDLKRQSSQAYSRESTRFHKFLGLSLDQADIFVMSEAFTLTEPLHRRGNRQNMHAKQNPKSQCTYVAPRGRSASPPLVVVVVVVSRKIIVFRVLVKLVWWLHTTSIRTLAVIPQFID